MITLIKKDEDNVKMKNKILVRIIDARKKDVEVVLINPVNKQLITKTSEVYSMDDWEEMEKTFNDDGTVELTMSEEVVKLAEKKIERLYFIREDSGLGILIKVHQNLNEKITPETENLFFFSRFIK
jgi:hypothetical protein